MKAKGRGGSRGPRLPAHEEEDELTGGEVQVVPEPRWLSLGPEPLDAARLERDLAEASGGRAGAVVVFSGMVRADPMDGGTVEEVEYEAYGPMAAEKMAHIRRQALSLFDVTEVAIRHRTGRIGLGGCSILVAASAPHRADAFRATEWALEEVKRTVPIWKKERARGSERWVEGEPTEATMGLRRAPSAEASDGTEGGPSRDVPPRGAPGARKQAASREADDTPPAWAAQPEDD